MGVLFGTDGMRGEINHDLNHSMAFNCGNALAREKLGMKILIGGDTRVSRDMLTLAFSLGAILGGADVVNAGILPTPAIAFLVREKFFDYGVVVSASHNSAEYNGIKIFDSKGYKLGDAREEILERKFVNTIVVDYDKQGHFKEEKQLINYYLKHLVDSAGKCDFKGVKIVLDCANGASYHTAPFVFKKLGAEVILINGKNDGLNINNHCGSTDTTSLKEAVLKHQADVGFAFDGDADRLIAVDEKGEEIDGDALIYVLAKYLKEEKRLKKNIIVATEQSNVGLIEALNELNIHTIRVDVGDKYVSKKLIEEDLCLGGEKSGHIILNENGTTGDGVMNAILITKILKQSKKKISELVDIFFYPQININVKVKNKLKVINSQLLNLKTNEIRKFLGGSSRVMLRASGTEPKIRIMIESLNEKIDDYANELRELVLKIDEDYGE